MYLTITLLKKKKKKPFIYLVGFQPGQTVYIYGNIEQHVGLKKHPHRGCRRYFPLSWILQRFERALCGPMDCSPRGSSGHGILQERLLEWLAISSRGSSQPRESNLVSYCLLHWREGSLPLAPPGKPKRFLWILQRFERADSGENFHLYLIFYQFSQDPLSCSFSIYHNLAKFSINFNLASPWLFKEITEHFIRKSQSPINFWRDPFRGPPSKIDMWRGICKTTNMVDFSL